MARSKHRRNGRARPRIHHKVEFSEQEKLQIETADIRHEIDQIARRDPVAAADLRLIDRTFVELQERHPEASKAEIISVVRQLIADGKIQPHWGEGDAFNELLPKTG